MANKRRSLEERILAREEKIKAEKAELERLLAIQDMAGPRSEWVDEMYATHGVEAQPKDPDETQRLALLREAMAAARGDTDGVQEELEKAQRLQGQLSSAVLKMAHDLGIHAESDNAVWAVVCQRYGIQ